MKQILVTEQEFELINEHRKARKAKIQKLSCQLFWEARHEIKANVLPPSEWHVLQTTVDVVLKYLDERGMLKYE